MARQTPTQQELDAVFNGDVETLILAADGSLDLGSRTVYGTTDPDLALSMVNVRHLNNTRVFRGGWQLDPTDGNLIADPMTNPGLLYKPGEVVYGSDSQLYVRQDPDSIGPTPNALPLDQNPDPTSETAPQAMRAWRQLGGAGLDEAVTELTSTPITQELNLFTASAQQANFNIEPTADAELVAPVESSLTVTGTIANGNPVIAPFNLANNELNVIIPNGQTDSNAAVVVTTAASSTSDGGASMHAGGQVDSEITFVDARQDPIVTQVGPSAVSRVRFGNLPESVSFNVVLVPSGTSVDTGTAYDVEWTSTIVGSGVVSSPNPQPGNFPLSNIINPTTVRFNFPFTPRTGRNGQTGSTSPEDQNFMINPYTPWFWNLLPQTAATPTDFTGFTESILTGDTTGRDFPSGDN